MKACNMATESLKQALLVHTFLTSVNGQTYKKLSVKNTVKWYQTGHY